MALTPIEILEQQATLYRPGELYNIEKDAAYTIYDGFCVRYPSDSEKPSEATLVAADHTSLNSIELWSRFGAATGKDYISVRASIYVLMLTAGGFANLSNAEKAIAAEYFVVDRDDRLSIFGTQEAMEEAGIAYHELAKAARTKRYEASIIHLYNLVNQPDANTIATDFYNTGVSALYVESGVRGSIWGNPGLDGILDYVNATPGSIYEPNGVRAGDTVPQTGTLDELCDDIIGIIMKDLA